jgi:hypothetical protein
MMCRSGLPTWHLNHPNDDLSAMISGLSNADLSMAMMIVTERLAV